MGKIIKIYYLLLILGILVSCQPEPHDSDDIEFFILNRSNSDILFKSFNGGQGDASYSQINKDGDYLIGEDGILNVDSLRFILVNTADTILFKNERHGGDLGQANHFF